MAVAFCPSFGPATFWILLQWVPKTERRSHELRSHELTGPFTLGSIAICLTEVCGSKSMGSSGLGWNSLPMCQGNPFIVPKGHRCLTAILEKSNPPSHILVSLPSWPTGSHGPTFYFSCGQVSIHSYPLTAIGQRIFRL